MSRSARELEAAAAALPLPIAALLRRARNAKSAKERHDAALCGWEASVRLAVALAPPADAAARASLALPSLGDWVRAAPLDARALLSHPALLSAARLLREAGGGEGGAPSAVTAASLLEPLPSYRNRVHGHGALLETAFYEDAGRRLADGLAAAWGAGVFWPREARLCFLDAIEIDPAGRRRGRVLELAGAVPLVLDPHAGGAVPDDALPRRLYARQGDHWAPLHPWALYEESGVKERVLFFNGRKRASEALDFAGGEALRGKALAAAFPGIEEEYARLFSDAGSGAGSGTGTSGEEDEARIGDYTLLGVLGEGGMGVVRLARQEGIGRLVALKTLPQRAAGDAAARRRFEREVKALARCDHPHVVKILAAGEAKGAPYYAMERIEGTDLAAHARSLGPVGGAGERERILRLTRLFRDAARGVAHIHEAGIVHRDITPRNLMVAREGERVVVMDLGLASLEGTGASATLARGQGLLGTLRYAAPEQVTRPAGEVDRRADIHGLGASFWEAYAGRPLRQGETEAEVLDALLHAEPPPPERANPALPRDLALVLRACVERDRARRYASAAALAEDLDAVLEARPVSARAPSARYRAGLFARRHRTPLAALAAALAVALGALAVWLSGLEAARARESLLRADAERESARAEESERAAVRARAKAEELLRFMLGDVQEKLEPLGKLSLLESVAEKARGYYGAQEPDALAPLDQARYAQALYWIASVDDSRGRATEARAALARAEAIAATAAARLEGSDPLPALAVLAEVQLSLARLDRGAGALELARAESRRALETASRRAARAPAETAAVVQRALATVSVARSEGFSGRWEESLRAAAGGLDDLAEALARDPPADDVLEARGALDDQVGRSLRNLGRPEEALAAIARAIAWSEGRIARAPSDAYARRNLAGQLGLRSEALRDLRRFEEAEAASATQVALVEEVRRIEPEDGDAKGELASALSTLGMIRTTLGATETAVADLERAAALLEGLTAPGGGDGGRWRREAALALLRLGRARLALGRLADAEAALARSLPGLDEAARADGARATTAFLAVSARADLLNVRRVAGRSAGEAIEAALSVAAALGAFRGRFPDAGGLALPSVTQLGNMATLAETDRPRDAATIYAAAAAEAAVLRDASPGSVPPASRVALYLNQLALVEERLGEREAVLRDGAAAREAWLALAALDPSQARLARGKAAGLLGQRGNVLLAQERLEEALAAYRASAEERAALLADAGAPDEAALLVQLFGARRMAAVLLGRLGRPEEERAAWGAVDETLARRERLAPASPDVAHDRLVVSAEAGSAADLAGRAAEAEERFRAAEEAAARCAALRPPSEGEAVARAYALARLAWLRLDAGDAAQALSLTARAVEVRATEASLAIRAAALEAAGEGDAALAAAEAAASSKQRVGAFRLGAWARGRLRARRGDERGALEDLAAAFPPGKPAPPRLARDAALLEALRARAPSAPGGGAAPTPGSSR